MSIFLVTERLATTLYRVRCLEPLTSISACLSASAPNTLCLQGIAFRDLLEGTYYATASLFTKPKPEQPAAVTFNFGPQFSHPPPSVPDFPAARPFSELPPPVNSTPGLPGAQPIKVTAATEEAKPVEATAVA